MAAADPILDLSTLIADRPPIRIDGVVYHLRSPDELTLAESHQFTVWGKELEKLGSDPEKVNEVEVLLRRISNKALVDVPPDVFQRLSPSQHVSIVEVFTVLLLGRRTRLAGAIAGAAARSTGQRPSRASSTPTAAPQDGGSMKRRPHSSGRM